LAKKSSFRCKLVTPTAALVDDQLTYASIPAHDGLMGIMPGRAPLLARLGVGELRLEFADSEKGAGGKRSFLVEGGFAKMADNLLTILAERATPTENLTVADAEAELRAAQGTPAGKSVEVRTQERQRARLKVQLAKRGGAI